MNNTLLLQCINCKKEYHVTRDEAIPAKTVMIISNYCPACDDQMTENYDERYILPLKIKKYDHRQFKIKF
jgi:hypothetical protein